MSEQQKGQVSEEESLAIQWKDLFEDMLKSGGSVWALRTRFDSGERMLAESRRLMAVILRLRQALPSEFEQTSPSEVDAALAALAEFEGWGWAPDALKRDPMQGRLAVCVMVEPVDEVPVGTTMVKG